MKALDLVDYLGSVHQSGRNSAEASIRFHLYFGTVKEEGSYQRFFLSTAYCAMLVKGERGILHETVPAFVYIPILRSVYGKPYVQ